MTLVVCWPIDGQLYCAADTRVSAGDITVLESGAKIFLIPVTYRATAATESDTRNFTLGFSLCGNALLGHNAHAIASTCCQIMHSAEVGAVPSAKAIATIYARVAEHVIKDFNSRRTHDFQYFQSIIFGFCSVEKRLKIFLLNPKIDVQFSIDVMEYSPVQGYVLAIGSGAN